MRLPSSSAYAEVRTILPRVPPWQAIGGETSTAGAPGRGSRRFEFESSVDLRSKFDAVLVGLCQQDAAIPINHDQQLATDLCARPRCPDSTSKQVKPHVQICRRLKAQVRSQSTTRPRRRVRHHHMLDQLASTSARSTSQRYQLGYGAGSEDNWDLSENIRVQLQERDIRNQLCISGDI